MTPAQLEHAIAAQRAPCTLLLWRAVEAQHVVATQPLVDTLAEQAELERILDATKPPVNVPQSRTNDAAMTLHWLLYTPFRYPPLPSGSRFRGPADPGVWYGAEAIRTACAELGYWRWRFLQASPALEALEARPQSLFCAELAGDAIDLREASLLAARAIWTHPDDYSGTQAFARLARTARLAILRYESVRDPEHAGCGAVLTPDAFTARAPSLAQTWLLEVRRERAIWVRASPLATNERFEFRFTPARV